MNYKFIFFYLLGVITVACLSFKAGFTYQVVKPFKPKYTAIVHTEDECVKYINQGYQVQQIAPSSGRMYFLLVKYFDEE